MKFFILLLTFAILLQTTLISFNLCLILLICRIFIVDEKENYYLAFFVGVMLGLFSLVNVGFYSFLFLILIKVLALVKKSGITNNFLLIIPCALVILGTVSLVEQFFLDISYNWNKVIIETILILPTYFLLRLWEERFYVRPQVKLKI